VAAPSIPRIKRKPPYLLDAVLGDFHAAALLALEQLDLCQEALALDGGRLHPRIHLAQKHQQGADEAVLLCGTGRATRGRRSEAAAVRHGFELGRRRGNTFWERDASGGGDRWMRSGAASIAMMKRRDRYEFFYYSIIELTLLEKASLGLIHTRLDILL
jgi:hypothetical protein